MMKTLIKKRTNKRQKGFSLIEVLVAMLILAIGILGIAALQFKGLKFNTDAYLRSQINFLAYDIADRIRLNRDNAADYTGNYTIPTTAPSCTQSTGANATNDLNCWHLQAYNTLPPGTTTNITAASGLYTITIGWLDREGDTHNITYAFQP